jgi:hypothetical protein
MDIVRQLATPILIELMLPVLMGAVSAGIGWMIARWRKITGFQMDEAARLRLNGAFENAIKYGLQTVLMRKGLTSVSLLSADDKRNVLDSAASYVETFNPGDIRKFGISSHSVLKDRLTPLLPLDRNNLG